MGREPRARDDRPLSVSELNRQARTLLESSFPHVWVRGEVSRPKRAPSGHLYFALKDAQSRIDAVMWASAARSLRFELSEGLLVNARGQLTLYPPQGRYQMVCAALEPAGEGELRAAFLALKAKLDDEGLTAPERKRPLPWLPRAVGLVTSPSGAAIHDLVQVIRRRFPTMPIVICPVKVQGPGAAADVARGIERMNRRDDVDVLVVGRGGGSIEDLWTFNDEGLARAIAASRLPVISAVGHEIDVTISDLVADVRALTPTEGGERAVPVHADLEATLEALGFRLEKGLRRSVRERRERLERLTDRPGLRLFPRRFDELRQELDELFLALQGGARSLIQTQGNRLRELGRILEARTPASWVAERRRALVGLGERLDRGARARLDRERSRMQPLERTLAALNPLSVLERGFSVTQVVDREGRRILRDSSGLAPGAEIRTTLARGGEVVSEVSEVEPRRLPGTGDAGSGDD